MDKTIFDYYQGELDYLRKAGYAFAKEHPEIASNLGISENQFEDPMLARLMESIAFLTSRIQYKLDHDQQALTTELLQSLNAAVNKPIPAMGLIEITPNENMDKPFHIDKGSLVSPNRQAELQFTTCYPLSVEPIKVNQVTYELKENSTESQLTIVLEKFSSTQMDAIDLTKLRFFINLDDSSSNRFLYLLSSKLKRIFVNESEIDPIDFRLGGFSESDLLLPSEENNPLSYQLLKEFFVFPKKHCYFTLTNQANESRRYFEESKIKIQFKFSDKDTSLVNFIQNTAIKLNVIPAINLFTAHTKPIQLSPKKLAQLIPDVSSSIEKVEIYQIDQVEKVDPITQTSQIIPNHLKRSLAEARTNPLHWYCQSLPSWQLGNAHLAGHEYYLGLTNQADEAILSAKITCTNRDACTNIITNEPVNVKQPDGTEYEYIENAAFCQRPTQAIRDHEHNDSKHLLHTLLSKDYHFYQISKDIDKLKHLLLSLTPSHTDVLARLLSQLKKITCTQTFVKKIINNHYVIIPSNIINVDVKLKNHLSTTMGFFHLLYHFMDRLCPINQTFSLTFCEEEATLLTLTSEPHDE